MKTRNYILVGVAVMAMLACAKTTTTSTDVYEQRALDAWMDKYAPTAVKMDNGGYYEVLVEALPDAERITAGKWIRLSYVIKDLEGNIVLTRSETVARQQGTFTKYTHYVPDFAYLMEENNTTMIQGQYVNLLDMAVGEVRRLYLPSKLGYGSSALSNSVGYGGQYSLSGGKPFIVDELTVLEIIDDAQQQDYDLVDATAVSWGVDLADSVKLHLYLTKLYTLGDEGDSVKADSTARIYYTGRFLDGFIFDTNIDSVRRRVYGEIRNSADTAAISFKKADATSLPAALFVPVCERFIYGDTIRMVISSFYAYGIAGRTGYTVESDNSSYYSPYLGGYGYGYGSYGGYGGYGGYDDYYYNSGYYGGYYNYQNTGTTTTLLRTEIQPYTPLIYDFVVMK